MAVSFRQPVYGLLNGFQDRGGISVWQFNQITGQGSDAPTSEPGEQVYVQPEREFIAGALDTARAKAWKELRFPHRPVYVSQTLQFDSLYALRSYATALDNAYVQAIGKRGLTLISAGAAVVYSDSDGDGVDDTATVTVATSVTEASEVQLFFTASASGVGAADERWQIEPVRVTFSGGNAVITGHRALFANPTLWRNPTRSPNYNNASKNEGDTMTAGDFVTTVDVYRVYPDTTDAVIIRANPYRPYPTTVETSLVEYAGMGAVADSKLGLVYLDIQPGTNLDRCAVSVEVNYLAGYPLDRWSQRNDQALETAIIRLARSDMPIAVPVTEEQRRTFDHDDAKNTEVFVSRDRFNNPFGTKEGALAAWDVVKEYRISRPVRQV